MVKILGAKPLGLLASIVLVLALAMQSTTAGLGLGEARVESYLGQPLQVRIALLEPTADALDSLTVDIASPEDHSRLGVPVEALALGLRVDIDRSQSPPVLRVRSSRPANEPFLQLLINARWASGRMLREYTLFLDPPTMPVAPPVRRLDVAAEPAASAQISPPEAPPVRPAERQPPAVAAATSPSPSPREAPRATSTQSSVAVRAGQTLWSIALAWRPDESVSMSQVMLAILERNPEAFADNNVNRLRRGAELIMPDLQAVRAIAPAEADRRIREQNASWRANQTAMPAAAAVVPAPSPEPVSSAPTPEPAAIEEPELAGDLAAGGAVADQAEGEAAGALESEPAGSEIVDVLPRLELTAADEELLSDSQAIGVERERLEQQLAGLVQELRAEGLESADMAAVVDQIRQAIDSSDAGGFMVASENLALLEQQLREARAERQQLAAQADSEPVVLPPAAGTASPGWMQPALLAGGLVLAALLILLFLRRLSRSRSGEAAESRVPPASQAVAAGPAQSPDGIDIGLAELYRLAEEEDHEGFGSALSSLHGQVESTDDPRWREAVTLARVLAPGHPLLLNRPGEVAPPPSGAGDRDLMDLLADTSDEAFEPSDRRQAAAAAGSDFAEWLDEQDREFDNPDLARVTNRLDPEELGGVDDDRLPLAADESRTLFAQDTAVKPTWEQSEDDQPLELDFQFSVSVPQEHEPEPELETGPKTETAVPAEVQADPAAPVTPPSPPLPSEDATVRPEPGSSEPGLDLLEELDLSSALDLEEAREERVDAPDPWFDLTASEEMSEDLSAFSAESAEADGAASATLRDDDAEVKLDLARAYLSMDDADSARALLEEILAEGSSTHRAQAQRLLDDLD